MATTQVTISKKQENKGAKGILDLTSTIGQVLKQFQGIYNRVLPECEGLTVEQWMAAHGVYRVVSGGGKKKDYTPARLMEAWHDGMKVKDCTGKVIQSCVFKNVAAKIVIAEPGDPDGVAYRVFTKEEAEKQDGKPISMYRLVGIEENKWSVATILKALKQKNNFQKENDKAVMSESDWEALEHVYIVKKSKSTNSKGESVWVNEPVEVDKSRVVF